MRRNIEKRWLFYVQTNSFSNFLIDTYDLETFLEIYNKSQLITKIVVVYGKDLQELEEE
ncbi:hypothetical protein ACJROX_15365 [Pseudalkalibacillus sp. A8]|uniref:hypothetical protein n=1 Tax=Pseudalkalibacillus sp. A8 TaxID=3382641 RepID=UPI0038B629CA